MGGAFTALGGDILNPEPESGWNWYIQVIRNICYPQLFHIKTIANFKSNSSEDYIYDFNLPQAGVVLNLINKNQSQD